MIYGRIAMLKYLYKNLKTSQISDIKVASIKIPILTALGLNNKPHDSIRPL